MYSPVQISAKTFEDFDGDNRELMGAWCSLMAVRFSKDGRLTEDENERLGRVMPVLLHYVAERKMTKAELERQVRRRGAEEAAARVRVRQEGQEVKSKKFVGSSGEEDTEVEEAVPEAVGQSMHADDAPAHPGGERSNHNGKNDDDALAADSGDIGDLSDGGDIMDFDDSPTCRLTQRAVDHTVPAVEPTLPGPVSALRLPRRIQPLRIGDYHARSQPFDNAISNDKLIDNSAGTRITEEVHHSPQAKGGETGSKREHGSPK
ncbi:hypothetical protein GE09DRAFT_1067123 [Coniochaeta sp. 2T2.1]|nr:hypothetical protein GE09DRAFT_1067123 [Coniochaeta sp. 2T2.1]